MTTLCSIFPLIMNAWAWRLLNKHSLSKGKRSTTLSRALEGLPRRFLRKKVLLRIVIKWASRRSQPLAHDDLNALSFTKEPSGLFLCWLESQSPSGDTRKGKKRPNVCHVWYQLQADMAHRRFFQEAIIRSRSRKKKRKSVYDRLFLLVVLFPVFLFLGSWLIASSFLHRGLTFLCLSSSRWRPSGPRQRTLMPTKWRKDSTCKHILFHFFNLKEKRRLAKRSLRSWRPANTFVSFF